MDRNLHFIWSYAIAHWLDLVWALILAAIAESLRIGSHIRGAIRHVQNKLAERSAGRIRKRVKSLEQYRDSLALYLSSDKAHYLVTLRCVLVVLVFMTTGASVFVLGRILARLLHSPDYDPLALGCFVMGALVGILALRVASLDTQAKISEAIRNIDSDIQKLRAKLPAP